MSNKNLFKPATFDTRNAATTTNDAGGKAYISSAKQTLAQVAATNCFNGTFYASAEDTLKLAKDAALALRNEPKFIAQAALYSRTKGYMKDMPAFLTVILAQISPVLFRKVFPLVIDNGKMLRNFVQIARSGEAGKVLNMSSGTVRHALNEWFASRGPVAIFNASVGNDPSMRDILRMARPRPENAEKAALYAYLKGAELVDGHYVTYKREGAEQVVAYSHPQNALPAIVQSYEDYKANPVGTPPKVDSRMLDSLNLDDAAWKTIASNAGWQATRMNLATYARHNVFDDANVTETVATRLGDANAVADARVFPYQLMVAYRMTEDNAKVPFAVKDALQVAMEHATANIPEFAGQIYVCPDYSGSMKSPVTGERKGSTSKVSCLEVAALFAAALLRKNKSAKVLPFTSEVRHVDELNSRDSVMTNAKKLASLGSGSTDCSATLRYLNQQEAIGDAVIIISDYESWVDGPYARKGTGLLNEWETFRKRNPNARLICMDLAPRANSQVKEHPNILQVGGFSDQVFSVISSFLLQGSDKNHWVAEIEKIDVNQGLPFKEND